MSSLASLSSAALPGSQSSVSSITAGDPAICDVLITVRGIVPAAKQGTRIMNANFNGISELSANDLDGVSGGNPVVAAAAIFFGGWLAGKTLDSMGEGKSVQDIAKGYAQQKGGKK